MTQPSRPLALAGGTVTGADHIGRDGVLKGRNNQDAYGWHQPCAASAVALVADGCGGAPRREERSLYGYKHSEVGAKIGVELMLRLISDRLDRLPQCSDHASSLDAVSSLLEDARREGLALIRSLAEAMTPADRRWTQSVRDYFLFTLLGVIVNRDWTTVFGIGDGVYAVNDDVATIEPLEGNLPPYLAYGMLDAVEFRDRQELLRFTVHAHRPTAEVETFAVGTDGCKELIEHASLTIPGSAELIGPLSWFWKHPHVFSNRFAVSRRLALINGEVVRLGGDVNQPQIVTDTRRLFDDTTLVVGRRQPSAQSKGEHP